MEISLNKEEARRLILLKQGLIGEYIFEEKKGIMGYIKQGGCIQFDPIDVCGKNPELVLQSRIKGFTKAMLYELLYEDRMLVDYFDKNLSIIPLENWKYFKRTREENKKGGRGFQEIQPVEGKVKSLIKEKGPLSSKELHLKEVVDWYWSPTTLSRAVLETLFFRGELIVHHKKGTNKYYGLTEDYISKEILMEKDPYEEEIDHIKWRVLKRISSVGLLWNRPSDAWLGIRNMKAEQRKRAFSELLEEGKIMEILVEGIETPLYLLTSDSYLIEKVIDIKKDDLLLRTELIAPLDNMLWDRKLIKELFNFDYKWEIYTPASMRKYGYYVLPILSGDTFIGRGELVNNKKTGELEVKRLWLEEGIDLTPMRIESLKACFHKFMIFNKMSNIKYDIELLGSIESY